MFIAWANDASAPRPSSLRWCISAGAPLLVALLGADSPLAKSGLEAALRTVSYILVIASTEPMPELEEEMRRLPRLNRRVLAQTDATRRGVLALALHVEPRLVRFQLGLGGNQVAIQRLQPHFFGVFVQNFDLGLLDF